MVLLPKGSAGKIGTQLTVNGMTISANSKAPDAAWKFLKFIMEPETQLPAILSGASRPGLRRSVLRHPKLASDMKSHTVWVDLIEGASPWHQPANYRWAEFNEQPSAPPSPRPGRGSRPRAGPLPEPARLRRHLAEAPRRLRLNAGHTCRPFSWGSRV